MSLTCSNSLIGVCVKSTTLHDTWSYRWWTIKLSKWAHQWWCLQWTIPRFTRSSQLSPKIKQKTIQTSHPFVSSKCHLIRSDYLDCAIATVVTFWNHYHATHNGIITSKRKWIISFRNHEPLPAIRRRLWDNVIGVNKPLKRMNNLVWFRFFKKINFKEGSFTIAHNVICMKANDTTIGLQCKRRDRKINKFWRSNQLIGSTNRQVDVSLTEQTNVKDPLTKQTIDSCCDLWFFESKMMWPRMSFGCLNGFHRFVIRCETFDVCETCWTRKMNHFKWNSR